VKSHVTMQSRRFIPCATFIPTSPQVSPPQPPSILVKSYDWKAIRSRLRDNLIPNPKTDPPRLLAFRRSTKDHAFFVSYDVWRFFCRRTSRISITMTREFMHGDVALSPFNFQLAVLISVQAQCPSAFSSKDLDPWLLRSSPYCGQTTISRPKKFLRTRGCYLEVSKWAVAVSIRFSQKFASKRHDFLPEGPMFSFIISYMYYHIRFNIQSLQYSKLTCTSPYQLYNL
jgi:hypothetical protein